ncbi:MAG: acyl carrier protein [Desulfobacterales bacterium]|nr:acyl carrier protein [Desulfobacterales bacterium]
MQRNTIEKDILRIFEEQFEIKDPGLDEDLAEVYEFDSIDAIELLREIEVLLGTALSRSEQKAAMEIRTINQITDYVQSLARQSKPSA